MNGSTECFHGKHIPLALLAIFFITLHTLLIPTIALFTYGKLKVCLHSKITIIIDFLLNDLL